MLKRAILWLYQIRLIGPALTQRLIDAFGLRLA